MAGHSHRLLYRVASVVAVTLLIAGCTKGGQFDPTEMFNSDVFDSKKKLKGERTPLFPTGVPGAPTGVPAELVKGYEPPPEQTDADAAVPGPTPPAAASEPAKPQKPKPKPRIAAQKPAATATTPITVGPSSRPAQASQSSQGVWPAPPQTAPSQPASAQPAQSSQSIWPDPPSGSSR
jgi:hypothetical protein